jgi:alpha-ketoglutarate-dependent 2,4-dichlorophenoxyacetate dioxygenase
MTITVYPITEQFVAAIGDIDLSKPIADDDERAVKAAFWKYAVLVFPGRDLSAQ